MRKMSMLERLENKFVITESGCWEWTAAKDRAGYGRVNGRTAHRQMWLTVVGPIDDGLHLDHLCRNRACVNPDHMEPVTPGTNIRRGVGVGGWKRRTTHCPQGHPYSEENTLVYKGMRSCRICKREQVRRWRASQKEK